MMRDVDPFDFWEGHASSIGELGGQERPVDSRYVFHTRYHEIRPGPAKYVLRLSGVRATFGELAVRLHALKPESDTDASYVAGARLIFDDNEETEIALPVRFAAQKGVLYALYGYLIERSDVTARSLQVSIDEWEDGEVVAEPPRSVLAMDRQVEEARPANVLLHYGPVETGHPVSQSCTVGQLTALGLWPARFLGHERPEEIDAALSGWSERLCRNALNTYAAVEAGLEGLVVGSVSIDFAEHFARSISMTRVVGGPPPPRTSGEFYDLLLMPEGSEAMHDASSDAPERWQTVNDWLRRLKIGGLAVLGLRYHPDNGEGTSSFATDASALSRNEIGQWCLRLIGSGYSVAPMAFAPVSELVIDSQGRAAFLLIVQRA